METDVKGITEVYGEPLADLPGLTEFNGRSSIDLIARLMYSEARGETQAGRAGVYYIVLNRMSKNLSEFGGNTYEGIILKQNQFAGMTSIHAREPDLTSSAWNNCLYLAHHFATEPNPIGSCLWFLTNSYYNSTVIIISGVEYYNFGVGAKQVVEKVILGGHTFFKVQGY